MNDMEYEALKRTIVEIKQRLDVLEAASTPRANSEQSIVGPPDVVYSENPALARPATLAELRRFIVNEFAEVFNEVSLEDQVERAHSAKKNILLQLEMLDQGPVARKPPVRSSRKQWESQVKPTES